ncbi:hypothetical protein LX36DRAFT_662764 [Colletotrichum falcatum]|nr:hypothetical protein LX36DRAFT_662764 [Colletotrichum falcatum]
MEKHRMRECKLGCITIIIPERRKRRPSGRGENARAVRVQPLHQSVRHAPTGHQSPPARRQATYGSGPRTPQQEPALPDHSRHGGVVGERPHLPAVNRDRPLETMFVDPSRSFTIGYDRRRQFGV